MNYFIFKKSNITLNYSYFSRFEVNGFNKIVNKLGIDKLLAFSSSEISC
jgi:hypothetical protein